MEDVGIFYGHLVNFPAIWNIFYIYIWHMYMAIWYSSSRFGTFYPFWYVVPRKIWQTLRRGRRSLKTRMDQHLNILRASLRTPFCIFSNRLFFSYSVRFFFCVFFFLSSLLILFTLSIFLSFLRC
jgi:hypothetical protein